MANLGTLFFGADIDLTQLQNKIRQGNQQILDALKMNYDPASYTQMVNNLKSRLSSEIFEIKVSTNAHQISQQLQQTVSNIGNSATMPKLNLGGLNGLAGLKNQIIDQRDWIYGLRVQVRNLHDDWKKMEKTFGAQSAQAMTAKRNYEQYVRHLQNAQWHMQNMNTARQRATLAQSELNKQMRDAQRTAKQWNTDHMRLNATLAGGIHISTQLGSALSSLFAIDAARQFLGQVIEIGGQLEKQRISIGAILGDTVKANHLFEQIKGLALKSPFGVVELDQYTKQLSAYGFKYNELFDMTKRLADISAGAGTDIGRLTLALGHVRSATYLTGITLRQFSMNNIPMLKMLADYYTELEGKIVSTAEVQKRISKREVSYQDVIEQIKRLTDEGGMFYNMQEKISESLAAKFKNLKDAMDIMYGEMAEGSVGDMLKGLAGILLKTTRHWREIANVMAVAAAAFMYSKLRIGLSTVAMQGNTAATLKQIMADKQLAANKLRAAQAYRTLTAQEQIQIISSNSLTVADLKQAMAMKQLTKEDVLRLVALKKLKISQAMHLVGVNNITAAEIRAAAAAGKWKVALAGLQMSLKNAFMGMGTGTWLTMGLMAGMEIYSAYSSWVDRIDDKSKEMQDLIKSRVIDLQKQQKIINGNGKPKDNAETKARVDDMKQVLANSEAYTKTLDEQLKGTIDINKQYDILADAIDKAVEKNKGMLDYQSDIAKMIKASSTYSGESLWDKLGQGMRYWFNDDITQNMSQTMDAYKNLRTVIDAAWEYKDAIKGVIDEMEKSGEISGAFAEQLKNAPFEEQIRILANSGYWGKIVSEVSKTNIGFKDFAQKIKDASNGVQERWEEIANDDIPRMMKKKAQDFDGDEKKMAQWALNNIDDFKMMLEGIADQLEIKEPAIRRHLKRLFYDYVRFKEIADGFSNTEEGKAMAAGLMVGASVFDNDRLNKLLDEDELADLADDTGGSKNDGKNQKDKILEAWKDRYDALKTYYDEVQKYVKLGYDVKSAMQKVKELGLGDGSAFKGMEATRENYAVLLRQLLSETDAKTTQRAKFQRDIKAALGDFDRDGTKEQMDKNVSIMKDYIKQMESQWKLYRDIMKKTGGRQDIAKLAFSDGMIWDDVAKNMLYEFNRIGKERGVIPVKFRWDMKENEFKESLKDTVGKTQDDLVELALNIQKVIRGNYDNFLKDTADAYSKSLTEQQKLNELIRERGELEKKQRAANTDEQRNGFGIQIEALNRQIADQQWKAFKETEEWGRVFSNLDKLSTQTLRNMRDALIEVLPKIKESVEGTKAAYEALDKIDKAVNARNPFATMKDALFKAKQASIMRKEARAFTKGGETDAAKKREGQAGDLEREAKELFIDGLEGLASKFKSVQDALEPVINLFDALGEEGLGKAFGIASDAMGSAVQMGSGAAQLFGAAAGPYGAAIGAALSVATSIFAMHDEALQEEIEASKARQKEMENLTKNLEKTLERTLGGVYRMNAGESTLSRLRSEINNPFYGDKLFEKLTGYSSRYKSYISEDTAKAVENAEKTKSYYDATYASMLAQRDELQHQMDSEQKKKDSDASAIADYKQQLIEMEDQIEYFAQDMAKSLWDIDVKSWAKTLTDTIVDAWKNGENAVDAYKKKVKEMMLDLTTNILSQKVMEQALEDIGLDKLIAGLMKDTKGELNEDSVAMIADKLNEAGEISADVITSILDKMEERGYVSKDDETESKSTGSSIKGVGEQTFDVAIGYWNAMRADISVNRAMIAQYFPQFLNSLSRCSTLAQTQVELQTQIAANTLRNADAASRIYDIMHKIEIGQLPIKVA